jgi:hypothetical protein
MYGRYTVIGDILCQKYLDNVGVFQLKIRYNSHVTGAQLFPPTTFMWTTATLLVACSLWHNCGGHNFNFLVIHLYRLWPQLGRNPTLRRRNFVWVNLETCTTVTPTRCNFGLQNDNYLQCQCNCNFNRPTTWSWTTFSSVNMTYFHLETTTT